MAEWSKALDLSSSILRMPGFESQRRHFGCSYNGVPVAQWIGRETTNLEIGGSSPSEDDLGSSGLVGYDDCLTRSRSPVRSRDRVPFLAGGLGIYLQWVHGLVA